METPRLEFDPNPVELAVQRAWETVCAELQKTVSAAEFGGCIQTVRPHIPPQNGIVLLCITPFVSQRLEIKRLKEVLRSAFTKALLSLGQDLTVRYEVRSSLQDIPALTVIPVERPGTDLKLVEPPAEPVRRRVGVSAQTSRLYAPRLSREDLTLEGWAEGESNHKVFEVIRGIVQNTAHLGRLVFLCGEAGMGKTHLCYAAANGLTQKGLRTRVLTGLDLYEFYSKAATNKDRGSLLTDLRDYLCSFDLLVIDEFDGLVGKIKTQIFLCQILDYFQAHRRPVICAGITHPDQLVLDKQLGSRLLQGNVQELVPPDIEVRTKIVHLKARANGLSASTELAHTMATWYPDPRRIEGSLVTLVTHASIYHAPLSLELAHEVLGPRIGQPASPPQKGVEIAEILAAVCQVTGQSEKPICAPERGISPVAQARMLFIYFCHEEGIPQPLVMMQIGRDRTTLIRSTSIIKEHLATRPDKDGTPRGVPSAANLVVHGLVDKIEEALAR